MLRIKNVFKEYKTGNFVQRALDDVTLTLRDNEFVAILGPSGSGKTTLLNVIGGLDRYDSGDLIINGITTKKYKDRDWDSYRNHKIGFIFQSYNLIPHQTVLSNVELAMTISGISRSERRKRAIKVLGQVGLSDHINKKPNQLSGGQMQRVAIARALVNDPEIILADEPTGALDSETSIQVMDLLKEVAKNRLVVMVTHNPELANNYANRIVSLKDGKIISDTNPVVMDSDLIEAKNKSLGKSSMSFLTSLSLSFNNLKTKKARTFLTAFAGSIGIIGIALILSISTGVNRYIKDIEEDTLSEYPVNISKTGFDMSAMLTGMDSSKKEEKDKNEDENKGNLNEKSRDDGKIGVINVMANMFSTVKSNDLKTLKWDMENNWKELDKYAKSIEYQYKVYPLIYRVDGENIRQVNPDKSFANAGISSQGSGNTMMNSMMIANVFSEMPRDESIYINQYDVKAGRWPEKYNEIVLVLSSSGKTNDFMLYTLGLRDSSSLDDMIKRFMNEETVKLPEVNEEYAYEDILGIKFKLVDQTSIYEYDNNYKIWKDKSENRKFMKNLVKNSEDITIVGIVQPKDAQRANSLKQGLAYPSDLTKRIMEKSSNSKIVKDQLEEPEKNIFTNKKFGDKGNSSFDLSKIFKVDQDIFKDAFKFDASVFNKLFNSLDFTEIETPNIDIEKLDLGNLDFKLPNTSNLPKIDDNKMPELDLEQVLSEVKLDVNTVELNNLFVNFFKGYKNYLMSKKDGDISNLGTDFKNFLQSNESKTSINEFMMGLLNNKSKIGIERDELQGLIKKVMVGFQKYAKNNGYDDSEKFNEYFLEYLETDEAKGILKKYIDEEILKIEDIDIDNKYLEKFINKMMSNYLTYIEKNNLTSPQTILEDISKFAKTNAGKEILDKHINKIINVNRLEKSFNKAMSNHFGQAMDEMSSQYKVLISNAINSQIQTISNSLLEQISNNMQESLINSMKNFETNFKETVEKAISFDKDSLKKSFKSEISEDDLKDIIKSMTEAEMATYEENLRQLGFAEIEDPSVINIYPKDFNSKNEIIGMLDTYNKTAKESGKEEKVISYTDIVGSLMSSVTTIVDVISYVLIAFVAISLIVSSIMIGVITYISVLERKKEIGILRAMGASKRNISTVFNAETIIIGFLAGLLGIGISKLIIIPINLVIQNIAGNVNIKAALLPLPSMILIILSIIFTVFGGVIPARKAAKSDPVTALRTE